MVMSDEQKLKMKDAREASKAKAKENAIKHRQELQVQLRKDNIGKSDSVINSLLDGVLEQEEFDAKLIRARNSYEALVVDSAQRKEGNTKGGIAEAIKMLKAVETTK